MMQHQSVPNYTRYEESTSDIQLGDACYTREPRVEKPLYYFPASEDRPLAALLSDVLNQLNWGDCWLSNVTERIGQSELIDHAATALIQAKGYADTRETWLKTASEWSYQLAIIQLRGRLMLYRYPEMVNNDAILAAALLFSCETVATLSLSHRGPSLSELLISVDGNNDALARRLLHIHWKGTFELPVSLGQPSLFETEYFLNLKPLDLQDVSSEVTKIRSISQKLAIQLPRMISQMRSLHQNTTTGDIFALATELGHLEDSVAEGAVLRQVRVSKTPTVDLEDIHIVPYSYTFKDVAQFEAAVLVMTIRLSHILTDSSCTDLGTIGNFASSPTVS
jgi:hypothetical protein